MNGLSSKFLVAALVLTMTGSSIVSAAPVGTDEVLSTAPDDPSKKQYKEVQDAVAKFQAGDLEGTLTLLEQAHEKYPELPPGQILLAQMFFKAMAGTTRQRQEQLMTYGRGALERAVEQDPKDPDAYLFLGDLAYVQSRVTEAELLFAKADELTNAMDDANPRKADLHRRCLAGNASVLETRNKLDEAIKLLKELTASSPDNAVAHYRLGMALFKKKEARSAFDAFKKATELKADFGPAGILMARLFEQAAQQGDAAAKKSADDWIAYSLSAKQGAKDPAAHLAVARMYWDRDDVANAKKHALEAQKLDASNKDTKLLMGLIARYERDLPTAEKLFEEVYKADPSNFAAANQFVISLIDQDDETKKGRALVIAEANMKDQQNSNFTATAAATLGWVYYRLGRTADAQKMLQGAMQAGRGNISGDTAYYVSRILADSNRADDAKTLLKTTLQGKGPFPYRTDCQELLTQLENSSTPVAPATDSSSPPN